MTIESVKNAILGFFGVYRFLSNFYMWMEPIEYNGILYPSVEHAFQAQKTLNQKSRLVISKLATPKLAKHAGRRLEVRDNWDTIKDEIMHDLIRIKFSQPKLARLLLNTGDAELIEVNTWGDAYWGTDESLVGKNRLGKILMRVRDELARKQTITIH